MPLEMKAPVFDRVLDSDIDVERKTVRLRFGGADKKAYWVELDLSCVPLAITALASSAGLLLSKLPEDKRGQVQRLPPVVGTQTAMMDDGTVTLVLHMEGGAELPLEFDKEALAKLSAQIEELLTLADPKRRN